MSAIVSRRRVVLAGAAASFAAPSLAAAPPPTGWLKPRAALPAVMLTGSDGERRLLSRWLAGKVTAVQLMFTGCSTSCPPQGALFAALAAKLPPRGFQLLSISIDALGDHPAALADWLGRFGGAPAWNAAVPSPSDVDRVAAFLKGASSRSLGHTAQVFVVDRDARLAYRTGDLPELPFLTALLDHIARG